MAPSLRAPDLAPSTVSDGRAGLCPKTNVFVPVIVFSRSRKRQAAAAEAERVTREALELIDTDDERALLLSGDLALVAPGVFLSTSGVRMERIDLEPTIAWVPEDLTPEVERVAMFAHLGWASWS